MRDLFFQDPNMLSPPMRRIALFSTRCAVRVAPVMPGVLLVAALAHFFFEVGNYPEPRARYAVGALFLFLFVPVTGAIWYFARRRVRVLRAVVSAAEEKS